MSQEELTEQMLKAALQEFYSKGYRDASIDAIAEKAKLPEDFISSCCNSKEELLEAVLQPLLQKVWTPIFSAEPGGIISDEKILLLFEYRQEFIILMDKSEGTKYEREKDRFIWKIETSLNRRQRSRFSDPVFIHIVADNFVDGLMNIMYHYKGKGWATMMLRKLSKMYLWGIDH